MDAVLLFKEESLNNVCEQVCTRVCACGGQSTSRVLLCRSLHCSREAELDWQPASPVDSPSLPPSYGYRHTEHAWLFTRMLGIRTCAANTLTAESSPQASQGVTTTPSSAAEVLQGPGGG